MTASAKMSSMTLDGGRYEVGEILRGGEHHGLRAGVRVADGRPVLVTVRLRHWATDLTDELRLDVPGVAPLLFVGAPDGYVAPRLPTTGGTLGAVIEARPPGAVLSDLATTLDEQALLRIGLGLFSIVAGSGGQRILGIRPETTYVALEHFGPRVTGVAPRSIRILSHHHDGYARAFQHTYLPPEVYTSGETSTSDLFSAALTLWAAFTGEHAYRVSPHEADEEVMAANDRRAFPGSPELASILEAVLVADPDHRPTAGHALSRMRDLAARWGLKSSDSAEI